MSRRTPGPQLRSLVMQAVAAALLLPLSLLTLLGGSPPASLIIVSGRSMEPTLWDDDLAVILKQPDYDVGDIIAFRTQGGAVIHRIVGGSAADGFVMKGDNRQGTDPWQPRSDSVLGRMILRVPKAGGVVTAIKQPPALAVLVGGLTLFALDSPPRSRRTARQSISRRRTRRSASPNPRPTFGHLEGALGLSIVLALLSASGAWFGHRMPVQALEPVTRTLYTHRGSFSYEAGVEPSLLYESDSIRSPHGSSGEAPVLFTRLVRDLDVGFHYALDAPEVTCERCEIEASVHLRAGDTWRMPVDTVGPEESAGCAASLVVPIDVPRLLDLAADVEEQTGYRPEAYEVLVEPLITVAGTVDGVPFYDQYSPTYSIQLGKSRIVPDVEMSRSEERAETAQVPAEQSVGFWRFWLPVREARRLTLAGAAAGSLLAAALAAWLYFPLGRSEQARIRSRYGAHLVSARRIETEGARTVDVASMADLSRLAMRDGQIILEHEEAPGQVRYLVDDGRLIYVYRVDSNLPEGEGAEEG